MTSESYFDEKYSNSKNSTNSKINKEDNITSSYDQSLDVKKYGVLKPHRVEITAKLTNGKN